MFEIKDLPMTGKAIKNSRVIDIVAPVAPLLALEPYVVLNDSLTHAIEVMAKNNLEMIAVIQDHQVIGVARLADALRKVGLC